MIIKTSLSRAVFPHTVRGPVERMPLSTAKHAAMAMGLLAASFAGFYYTLKTRDGAKREKGILDQYESTLLGLRSRPSHYPLALNPGVKMDESLSLPKIPVHEHDAQHHTIPYARALGTYGNGQRIQQPAPQRPKGDGSGLVYTKKSL